ncbi:unnamed protein product [Lasius platythorax]|uniref:Uncharacterized protein n=1 Tax=Lasius platythorax TaxID=488582 RepID=A0AAV2N9V1_9HYME
MRRKSYELALSPGLFFPSNEPRAKKQLGGNWIVRSTPLCIGYATMASNAVFLKTAGMYTRRARRNEGSR